ncbi:serine/threonine-protein kinase LMTK3-like isoform X3 [Felis catus]|uniref:serine/threonine-protein kinase LMTK3-like isoform X3 n=1 Tax=Felis catus TaxID=9685 RepID=UPI001D19FC74|nr:serine/threonine-protein kinase LMTK3-like isoform X3 [Felis catus]
MATLSYRTKQSRGVGSRTSLPTLVPTLGWCGKGLSRSRGDPEAWACSPQDGEPESSPSSAPGPLLPRACTSGPKAVLSTWGRGTPPPGRTGQEGRDADTEEKPLGDGAGQRLERGGPSQGRPGAPDTPPTPGAPTPGRSEALPALVCLVVSELVENTLELSKVPRWQRGLWSPSSRPPPPAASRVFPDSFATTTDLGL